jgi:hypothetical protein
VSRNAVRSWASRAGSVGICVTIAGSLALGLAASSHANVLAIPKRDETPVRVTLVVPKCEGCTAIFHSSVAPREEITEFRVPVKGGRATLAVPRWRTVGMSFSVSAPPEMKWGGNAIPVVRLGFEGRPLFPRDSVKPGTRLSWAQVKPRLGRSNHCWAGTRASSVTIPLRVKFVREPEPFPGKWPTYWASPTVRTYHNDANSKGLSGHQDMPYCTQFSE